MGPKSGERIICNIKVKNKRQNKCKTPNRQGRTKNKKKMTVSETVPKSRDIFLVIMEKNKKRGGFWGKRNMVSAASCSAL